jgi:hypothetical protein
MYNSLYNMLFNAYFSKTPVEATVSVKGDDEKRIRIGTIDRMIHHVNTPKEDAYVTFALQDGTFRTARLSQFESLKYLPS